jgi:hypothetical protein
MKNQFIKKTKEIIESKHPIHIAKKNPPDRPVLFLKSLF